MYIHPCRYDPIFPVQALANQALQLVGADSTAAAAGALLREIGAWGPHMHPATLAFQETAFFAADIEASNPAELCPAACLRVRLARLLTCRRKHGWG